MKTCIKNVFLLLMLLAGLGLILVGRVTAQTFSVLHSFTATGPSTGTKSDGNSPSSSLILSGNTLYGTAFGGGSSGAGAVFRLNTDGTGFTTLHGFTGGNDGAVPLAGLLLLGNTLAITNWIDVPPLPLTLTNLHHQVTVPSSLVSLFSAPTAVREEYMNEDAIISPVVVSGQNTMTSPVPGTQQFFRLSQ